NHFLHLAHSCTCKVAKRKITGVKLTRLEARTRVIQGASRVGFVVFCMAIGFVVVATAIPQRRELDKLELKLKAAKVREQTVLADRECHFIEHRALREDPAFLEIHARDRLDYYREGERVLKFKREQ
ncbi:MAG: hypothetical protein ABI600_17805, partial [Luteolibacter sp.]